MSGGGRRAIGQGGKESSVKREAASRSRNGAKDGADRMWGVDVEYEPPENEKHIREPG